MTLIDEREVMFEQEKKQKLKRNIIKIIAILIILVIVLLVYISTKNAKKFKILVDGNEQTNIDNNLIFKNEKGKVVEENGDIYISVRNLSTMLNYQYYNSEYKKKGEDKTKCQVRIQNEYTSYIADSNKVYKTIVTKKEEDKNKKNNQENEQDNIEEEYEYFTINNNIKYVNDEIYASTEAIELGFDISISYDKKKNTLSMYSSDYLETLAKSKRADIVPSTDYDYINKRLLKYGMTIVKDTEGNLGVGSYTNSDKLNTYVASCKYSSIKFNEGAQTLDVITSADNKQSVLQLNLDNQEVGKTMNSQYDEIKEADNSFTYFVIKDKEKYGIINSDGKIIVYPLFEQIGIDEKLYTNIDNKYILNNKYIPVKQDGKWGLYSIEGKKLIEPQFQDIGCTIAQSGDSVDVIPNIKDNIDGIVFLYNKEKSLYGIYNAENGSKIAISLGEVFKKSENNEENYYMNYVIDKENNVVHTLNAQKDI